MDNTRFVSGRKTGPVERMKDNYKEVTLNSSEELWQYLAPTQALFPKPHQVIFRGQADANWGLRPSVLRTWPRSDGTLGELAETTNPREQIFLEMRLLEVFADHCDRIGLRMPGDSVDFRKGVLNSQNIDRYLKRPELWPNPALFEVMAFAQHHGVPTRLLDWCRTPYVAIYFAAAGAVRRYRTWNIDDRLAIWAFNVESSGLYVGKMEIVRVPGSVSEHLAAQAGLFTVQKGKPDQDWLLDPPGLEKEITCAGRQDLQKITVPVQESGRLLELCEKVGISGASLKPSPDGAALAVEDQMYQWAAEVFARNQS